MQKIVLLAVLVILASAFTPLANLKCDAANTGTKTRSYETTSTPSDDVDWVTVGEHYGPGTNAGTTTSTNVYLMKKGNEYKTKTVTPDLTVYVSTYTSTV